MTQPERPANEDDIKTMVRRFYDIALADSLLGPMFRAEIPDLEVHLPVVENFWSHALLGTSRYSGSPYAMHAHLKVEEAHFDRWMAAFTQAVQETLPPAAADAAMKRARHMTMSFKVGLIPLPTPRHLAKQAGS